MSDYLIRGMAEGGFIRAFAATSKELVQQAVEIHHLSPVAAAALGRTLTAGTIMGSMMKNEKDVLTIIFNGDGPIGGITVTADAAGHVKGYVKNPDVMLPPSAKGKLDVGGAVGHGLLRVIRDTGLKEPYVGETAIITGEIAEDLTAYYLESEQIPSAMGLGVLMNHDNTVREAGGFMIQLMPFAPDDVIDRLEERLSKMTSVTELLKNGGTPESILGDILEGMDFELLDTIPISYHCDCTRSRVTKALIAIGSGEIEDMIREGKPVSLGCQFCGKNYEFNVDDLKVILEAAKG